MTVQDLLLRLPAMREIFATPMQMEWSIEEYRRSARALDKRLLAALDRWAGKAPPLEEDDIIV
jgi:hypothetical protein